jgi:hypothetical protein
VEASNELYLTSFSLHAVHRCYFDRIAEAVIERTLSGQPTIHALKQAKKPVLSALSRTWSGAYVLSDGYA